MKNETIIVIILVTLTFIAATSIIITGGPELASDTIDLTINNRIFTLEIAKTPMEVTRGLMNRNTISEDGGMIFIFDSDEPRSFWMKDTLVNLDMIFVNYSNHIVDINRNAKPCIEAEDCISYQSSAPAKYVIEFNADVAEEMGLEIGQQINITI